MRALFFIGCLWALYPTARGQMVLSGSATGACDCYDITDNVNQAGSIWSPTTIDLTNPFDFTFNVNLGADDVWGADGMMFALRQSGTSSGGIGNGMGYSGISNSVGIEIDTWNSSPAVATDIVSDHLGMSSNGTVEHDLVAPVAIPNIEDGLFHDFRIVWDPATFELEVFLDGASMFVYTGDMVALFFGGSPDVYFGWTGGTGGVDNNQSVCMYRDANLAADDVDACVDQVINFTDISTSDLIYNTEDALTWAWDLGDGTTSSLENPTHAYTATGTYTVTLTITDISGCSDTETLTIEVNPPLDITMSQTNVTCFGLNNGTATATPTTGVGPYTFLWDDPVAQTTGTATALAPNTFNVLVTDTEGCVGSGTVTITEPTAVELDGVLATNASCGLDNGTLTIAASGGIAPLEYSIDGGATFAVSGSFTGLSNGAYDVVIRDANGCEVTSTENVGLDSPLSIDALIPTDETCGPVPDGTITVTASSGALPYQYSIDGGVTYQVANVFTGLTAGTYTVTVLDNAGCDVSMDVTVGSLSTVVIDLIATTDVTCSGDADGTVSIVASGGTPMYEYSLDGGTTYVTGPDFTGLSGGTHGVAVKDAAGCTATGTAVISEPAPLTLTGVLVTGASCAGSADGELELTVEGGTPAYEYSMDGGVTYQLSPVFTGLAAGVYPFTIRDVNGCDMSGAAPISEPALLAIDAIDVTDVTCDGAMDGMIDVDMTGGTAPYQYRIDGGAWQAASTFTGLGSGPVVVEVVDANGCTATGDAVLNEAAPLVLTMGADTTICLGGMAELCPTVTGGTMPYTYMWDGVAGAVCLSTAVLGDHELQIIDVNGCTSDVLSQHIDQYVPLTVFSSSSATICPGDPITLAGEGAGGGPEALVYEWTNDVDDAVMSGPVQTVSPAVTTNYTLTVSTGCENTASTIVTVTTYPVPDIIITADVTQGCQALEVNLESLTDPTLVATSSWNLGDGTTASGTMVNHTYEDAMCYDVTLDITTIDGCALSETFADYICVWPLPVADFSFEAEQPDLFNREVVFTNESEGADAYTWTFGDGGSSEASSPVHTYPELGNQTYEVVLTATTSKGCEDVTRQRITVEEIVLYFIPNTFTPNADPFNQTFYPVFLPGFIPSDYHFQIFNRWGELVWESYDPAASWDGTYGDKLVDDGVYIWDLTFRENGTDRKERKQGHVTLLK